ncbi:MAG: helix-turn-helix domain-containing protein [Gordonia sp. (in: high G+C Gram-positive bacteria)]
MRLGDLLLTEGLGLRLLDAAPGALDREFRWTYQTDLPDPRRYLAGGELILSGLSWRTGPGDAESFVAAVVEAGAVGLVAGDLVFDGVPDDVVAACRAHGLPILGLASEISFVTVAEFVANEARTERRERERATVGRRRDLLGLLAAGRPLDALLDQVARDGGPSSVILTATGLPMTSLSRWSADGIPLSAAHLDRISEAFVTAAALPAVVRVDGRSYSVFSVGPGLGNRLTSWMLVAEGDVEQWSLDHVDVVADLAALAQLDRARRDEGRRALGRAATDLFRLLAGGGSASEISVQLTQCGLDAGSVFSVLIGEIDDAPWQGDEQVVIGDAAGHVGPSIVGTWTDGRTAVVVEADDDDLAGPLEAAVRRLAPGLAATPLSLGVSEPVAAAGLAAAAEEARQALGVAREESGPVRVVFGHQIASASVLFAGVAPDVRAVFAQRVLGAVVAHDAETGSALLDTLRVFLACDGSWAASAAELGVHVNTVRHRIERIEELTGRDLSTLTDRMDCLLAAASMV